MCETSYKAASLSRMWVGRVPRYHHHRVKSLLSQMWANLTLIAKPPFTAHSRMHKQGSCDF